MEDNQVNGVFNNNEVQRQQLYQQYQEHDAIAIDSYDVWQDDLGLEIHSEYALGQLKQQQGGSINSAYTKRMVYYCNGIIIYEAGCRVELKEYGQTL